MVAPIEVRGGAHHAEDGGVRAQYVFDDRAGRRDIRLALVITGQRQPKAYALHIVGRERDLPLEHRFAHVLETEAGGCSAQILQQLRRTGAARQGK